MDLNELFPRPLGAFGRRVDALFLEDVVDGLSADAIDSKATQLTEDTGVTDAGFARCGGPIHGGLVVCEAVPACSAYGLAFLPAPNDEKYPA